MTTNLCNGEPISQELLDAPTFPTDNKAVAWAQDNPGNVCRSTESDDFFETPETIETYSDSVRAEIRLSERQVAKLLADHNLSFIEFHADRAKCAYDEKTGTWSANDLLAWLGY